MLYTVSVQCPGASAGSPIAMLRNPNASPVGLSARIREVEAFCNTATAAAVGLIVAASQGTFQPGNSSQGQPFYDKSPQTATCFLDFGWSAPPSISGTPIYLRQAQLQAAQGAGIIWPFDREPLIVSPQGGLLLWNFGGTTTPAMTVDVTWDE
jgi:hypothetical protein